MQKEKFKRRFFKSCIILTQLIFFFNPTTVENIGRFLKKLKIKLPYDPAILLLGIYPEKTTIQKDIWQNQYNIVK